uniref:Uncharacterized protein n=1 Tax=Anopheles maculatus TaxID=74869 RepID=A0A182SFT3_9DIPT
MQVGPSSHHQLQQALPNATSQHTLPQMRPSGQQPPVSYPSYVPQPQQQQQQQQQPVVSQPGQQTTGPPPASSQPIQSNISHHPHASQHLPMNMPPAHFPPASGPQQQQQQQPQQFMPQMGAPPMGNFAPMMGGPMNMFPPGGPGVVGGGPLSINTNHHHHHQGPQNIPIYQQQR